MPDRIELSKVIWQKKAGEVPEGRVYRIELTGVLLKEKEIIILGAKR